MIQHIKDEINFTCEWCGREVIRKRFEPNSHNWTWIVGSNFGFPKYQKKWDKNQHPNNMRQ